MTTVYCCGAAPTVAAFARDIAEGRAVVICAGGCASADALLAETRSRKGR